MQGTLDCGDIAGLATQTCLNTFVLQVDRRYPLDNNSLAWAITADELHALAERFRPYLKYSRDWSLIDVPGPVPPPPYPVGAGSTTAYVDEIMRPSTWQWYVQHSDLHETLFDGDHIVEPNATLIQNLTSFEDVLTQGGYNFFDVRTDGADKAASLQLTTQYGSFLTDWRDLIYGAIYDPAGTDYGFTRSGGRYSWPPSVHVQDIATPAWNDTTHGIDAGAVYAHAEKIEGTDLINLEYIVFHPFNHGLNNSGCQLIAGIIGEAYDHEGDIDQIELVYDKNADQIIRAAFSDHGEIMIAYDLSNRTVTESFSQQGIIATGNIKGTVDVQLLGSDRASPDPAHPIPISVPAKKVVVVSRYIDRGHYIDLGILDTFGIAQSRYFYEPEHDNNYVFFVADPVTGRFEHIVAYIEWGSHEMYAAPDGLVACLPNHSGNGSSFLPAKVTYLGTMDQLLNNDPRFAQNAPFVFFNGKWGDPAPPIMHNEWYYPHNRNQALNDPCLLHDSNSNSIGSNNPFFPSLNQARFVDRSPYNLGDWDARNPDVCTPSSLAWPPVPGAKWDITTYKRQTELLAGQSVLYPARLSSENGRFQLRLQSDGDLVLYDTTLFSTYEPIDAASIWHSCTQGYVPGLSQAYELAMQPDGNLVFYISLLPIPGSVEKIKAFETHTNIPTHPGAYLVVQDDGDLVVFDSNNTTPLWTSNSGIERAGPGEVSFTNCH
jgi:hypothetical protein